MEDPDKASDHAPSPGQAPVAGRRLLLLDFDGVLNSDAYFESAGFREATTGLSDAEVMLTQQAHHLDPARVALVNRLVEALGAAVVVSSSWRLRHSLDELNTLLASRGATFQAIDVTPRVTEYDPTRPLRAREILAYLASLAEPPASVVVLDDDDLQGLVPGHVHLDGAQGLQEAQLDAIVGAWRSD